MAAKENAPGREAPGRKGVRTENAEGQQRSTGQRAPTVASADRALQQKIAAAKTLIEQGWSVFLLRPKSKLPHAVYAPKGFKDATRNVELVKRWLEQSPLSNIGAVPPEGTYVVDVDVYKNEAILGPLALRLAGLHTPLQRSGGGGTHYLLRGKPPRAKDLWKRFGVEDGIDIKAHGKGYIVVEPSVHPETGAYYEWGKSPTIKPADAPDWLVGQSVPEPSRQNAGSGAEWAHKTNVRIEDVQRALMSLSADCDNDTWVRYGQALHLEYGEAGWHLWHEWSATASTQYKGEEDCRRRWDSFGMNVTGAKPGSLATVRSILRDASQTQPAKSKSRTKKKLGDEVERELVIVNGADVWPASVNWLWHGKLPRKFLSVFAADSGSGKSMATAAIAAILTTGRGWPNAIDQGARQASDVVWLGVEDPLEVMTIPRLMAAGADLQRMQFVEGVRREDREGKSLFSLQDDLDLLRDYLDKQQAKGAPVALIVVDPVTAYLHGEVRIDAYRADELRRVLQPFADLADEKDLAVICITHLTKDKTRGFIDSVMGSQALVAIARNVWGFARVPGESENSFAMVWGKGNLGPPGTSIRYRIESAAVADPLGHAVETSRVVWAEEDPTLTTQTVFGAARGPVPNERNAAMAWLRDHLEDGQWHDSASVEAAAELADPPITKGTLRRAREAVCDTQAVSGRGRMRLKKA